jgi:hypothetical protein
MRKKIKTNALTIVKKFASQVTSVEDAVKDVNIWIVNQDISNRGIKNHQGCAVAQACKRAFRADSAIVGTRTAYMVFGKKALRFRVPTPTSQEIKAFDRGKGFRTGTFLLKAPNKGEKLGGGYTGKTHNPSTRQRPTFKHERNVRATLKHARPRTER